MIFSITQFCSELIYLNNFNFELAECQVQLNQFSNTLGVGASSFNTLRFIMQQKESQSVRKSVFSSTDHADKDCIMACC